MKAVEFKKSILREYKYNVGELWVYNPPQPHYIQLHSERLIIMIETLFKVLNSGLELWSSKEKTKYLDKLLSLKRDYYNELNKAERSDATLDHLEFEIKLLADSFVISSNKKNEIL